ncbi:MAG: DUF1844 domain-containing protein [Bacteroidota bacterium]|nr:DUF1844 domain-containing protein [Bacteroidota bacterium]MDP4190000.1 DUF1844 domain-containing protein [Bacteroidota bacterium]MDP4193432.1 DUF1844 domain-containing protein [Bacteroidota bacterium]
MAESELNELLFMQVIFQNQQLALMGLGKVKNPVTEKFEKNIEQAKMAIDILDMLVLKTKGNLTQREEQYLSEVLRELKLTYVNESK